MKIVPDPPHHRSLANDDSLRTVGKTVFYQGENHTHALFRIEPGIPCQSAREQASELWATPVT